jgi:hypothetical protein
MVAEAGVDAAHGVEAEGVARRRLFRFAQGLGGLAVAMNQRQEAGELGPILPLTVERDRTLEVTDPGAHAAASGVGQAGQEMRLGLVWELARHRHGMVASRRGVASCERCARSHETSWLHRAAAGPAMTARPGIIQTEARNSPPRLTRMRTILNRPSRFHRPCLSPILA